MTSVYKILRPAEWEAMTNDRIYRGTVLDLKDGFIHLSTREQVDGTIKKYFADADKVYLLEFDANTFGDDLKWEKTKSGDVFPHLYNKGLAIIDMTAMSTTKIP